MTEQREWNVPGTHIQKKTRKDGSESFQAQIRVPARAPTYATFKEWETAAEHIRDMLTVSAWV